MSGTTTLGTLDLGTTPSLGTLLTPIQPTSFTFESIKNDLVTWATSKPGNQPWNDWSETDDGTIIAEWVAGLAVFRKLAETMRQREGSLDFAQLESSIFELAFNRGLLVPPAAAPILQLSLQTTTQVSVSLGDLVGTIGTYELYSLEGKTLGATDTLQVAVGHLNTFTPVFSTLGQFTMFQAPQADKYVARELEAFVAGGQAIQLLAEPMNLGGFSNGFILRRVVPGQVRLYVGNGVMGWWDGSVNSITYTSLSYGTDVTTALTYAPTIALAAVVADWTQIQAPSFDPDKETLRAITRYYPLDGRIVRDEDYEAVIRKYFGGVLYDVIAYNSDPDENVYLLPKGEFGTGTQTGTLLLGQIQALVDSKRMLNIDVHYTVVAPSAGRTFALGFTVPAAAYSFTLQQQVNTLLVSQLNVFARKTVTMTAIDIATQLSAKFGVKFTPLDASQSITLAPTDFLSSFTIGLASGS